MKRIIFVLFSALMIAGNANAQAYTNSKYYNPRSGKLDYSSGGRSSFLDGSFAVDGIYYGFRIGPAFSTISSDDNASKADESRTGLNIGAAVGTQVTTTAPLFFESGLYYVRKGGNETLEGQNLKYNLDYILIPAVFKYDIAVEDPFSIQPFFGLYGGLGIGGKVKNYTTRTAESAFGRHYDRFDAGLRFGCGLSYAPFYVDLTYDLGLTNISDDDFNSAHTRSLMLNFGVNF